MEDLLILQFKMATLKFIKLIKLIKCIHSLINQEDSIQSELGEIIQFKLILKMVQELESKKVLLPLETK